MELGNSKVRTCFSIQNHRSTEKEKVLLPDNDFHLLLEEFSQLGRGKGMTQLSSAEGYWIMVLEARLASSLDHELLRRKQSKKPRS